jgi:hypothetical protein
MKIALIDISLSLIPAVGFGKNCDDKFRLRQTEDCEILEPFYEMRCEGGA